MWESGRVSVVQAGHGTKYIVKCSNSAGWYHKGKMNIFDRNWYHISTININTDGLTVTPGGKLLLAYNNRFHEYSQDGKFIRNLLDEYQFIEIRDITWSGGYLWVLEVNPCCIKIFVAN